MCLFCDSFDYYAGRVWIHSPKISGRSFLYTFGLNSIHVKRISRTMDFFFGSSVCVNNNCPNRSIMNINFIEQLFEVFFLVFLFTIFFLLGHHSVFHTLFREKRGNKIGNFCPKEQMVRESNEYLTRATSWIGQSSCWIEILWHFNGQQAFLYIILISRNFMASSRAIATSH